MSFLQRIAAVVLVVGAAALAMAQIGGGGFSVVQYLSGGAPVSVTSLTPLPVTAAGGSPVASNITQWDSVALGAPSAYGTSPGAVNVPGVNANVTASALPTGAATATNQTNGQGTVAVGAAAANSNLDGCVYNSSAPSPSNGQGMAAQCDSAGNWLVDVKTALPAGQNSLGNVGALTKSVCIAPTVTNGTYAANTVVGNNNGAGTPLLFANLFTSTGSGTIQTVTLTFTTVQTVGFLLTPFHANPTNTTWTDNSAVSIAAGDKFFADGAISLANPQPSLGTITVYNAAGIGQAYVTGSTSGWFILQPTAGTASLGGTANVAQICVTVLRDS